MKHLKKISKTQKGFTLIEVIVAVAILMIIVFSFTLMFTTSFSGIFRAGHKSRALFETQDEMDNKIAGNLNSGVDSISVQFDQIAITVVGEIKEVTYEYEGRNGVLYYFLPEQ